MSMDNPYQAPRAAIVQADSADCRREGKHVFIPLGQDLPPRCVVCNGAVAQPVKARTFYWHTPWLYLLLLLNVLIFALVALVVRKKAVLSPGWCEEHLTARQRRIKGFMAAAAGLTAVGTFMLVVQHQPGWALLMIPAIILVLPALRAANSVSVSRIDKTGVRLAGCQEPFLNSLR